MSLVEWIVWPQASPTCCDNYFFERQQFFIWFIWHLRGKTKSLSLSRNCALLMLTDSGTRVFWFWRNTLKRTDLFNQFRTKTLFLVNRCSYHVQSPSAAVLLLKRADTTAYWDKPPKSFANGLSAMRHMLMVLYLKTNAVILSQTRFKSDVLQDPCYSIFQT